MAMSLAGVLRWAPGTPTEADVAEMRQTGAPPAALLQKVRLLPQELPSTARLVNAHLVNAPNLLSILLVDVESFDDIDWINRYYSGWFHIDWHPTRVVPRE